MGVIGAVASSIGAEEAALRLMLSLMFGKSLVWGKLVTPWIQASECTCYLLVLVSLNADIFDIGLFSTECVCVMLSPPHWIYRLILLVL